MHTHTDSPPAAPAEPATAPFAEGPAINVPTIPPIVLECQRLQDENENLKNEWRRLEACRERMAQELNQCNDRLSARIVELERENAALCKHPLDGVAAPMAAGPMLPGPVECGVPCGTCEAHAHLAAKLREELESVRAGSAKVCRELREQNAKLRTALTDIQFAGHIGYARTIAEKTLEETL